MLAEPSKSVLPLDGAATATTANERRGSNSKHSQNSNVAKSFSQALDVARRQEARGKQGDNKPVNRKAVEHKTVDKPVDKPAKRDAEDRDSKVNARNERHASNAASDANATSATQDTNPAQTANDAASATKSDAVDSTIDANIVLMGKQPTPAEAAQSANADTAKLAASLLNAAGSTADANATANGKANAQLNVAGLGAVDATGASAGADAATLSAAAGTPLGDAAKTGTAHATHGTEAKALLDANAVAGDAVQAVEANSEVMDFANALDSLAKGDNAAAKPATETTPSIKTVDQTINHLLHHETQIDRNVPSAADATNAKQVATPTQMQETYKQVVNVVVPLRNKGDGDYSVTLKLHPEHLGSVEVVVSLSGGQVNMAMNTDNPNARDLLRDQMEELRRALEGSGLATGNLDVSQGDNFNQHLFGNQDGQAGQPTRGLSVPVDAELGQLMGTSEAGSGGIDSETGAVDVRV